mmetsp:Transcript_55061/g.129235  ORF Transcript_55061/g.129235 Transcript_55061/m.129235 type:complete len:261 (-) Transcript_55061:123-905(-)
MKATCGLVYEGPTRELLVVKICESRTATAKRIFLELHQLLTETAVWSCLVSLRSHLLKGLFQGHLASCYQPCQNQSHASRCPDHTMDQDLATSSDDIVDETQGFRYELSDVRAFCVHDSHGLIRDPGSKFAGNALTAVQNVCDAYLLQTVQAARGHLPPQKKPPLPYVGGIFHRLANRQRRTALPGSCSRRGRLMRLTSCFQLGRTKIQQHRHFGETYAKLAELLVVHLIIEIWTVDQLNLQHSRAMRFELRECCRRGYT